MDLYLLDKIRADHWAQVEEASTQSYIERTISFEAILNQPEITVISGVRRCGKSHVLRVIAKSLSLHSPVLYLDFEDARLSEFQVSDWFTLYEHWLAHSGELAGRRYILVDEVQDSPLWERSIPSIAKFPNVKIVVTGSNSRLLSSELSTYLTGRYQLIQMFPLSWKEIAKHEGVGDSAVGTTESAMRRKIFENYKSKGGFPRAYLSSDLNILRLYYRDIILNDVTIRKKVKNHQALLDLSLVLATENGSILNLSKLGSQIGLKEQPTVKKYVRYFEEAYLFKQLRQFDFSLRKIQRSLLKSYCVDPAMARENGLSVSPNFGRELETLVCAELQRRGGDVFYWHSKKDYGVDFIVRDSARNLCAIQVCRELSNEATIERESRALIAAKEELGIKDILIISDYPAPDTKRDGVTIPVRTFIDWALNY